MSGQDRLFQLVQLPEPSGPLKRLFGLPQPIDFEDYARAYWDAAKELAGEGTLGSLSAFPAIFLYRHAIEIYIKAILIAFGDGIVPRKKVQHHSLADLLPHLAQVCERARLRMSPELERAIREWHSHDPDGMNLRYPEKKQKKERESTPERVSRKDVFLDGKPFDLKVFTAKADQALEELQELFSDLRNEEYSEIVREQEGL